MKFLCDQCKAKYQISDDKVAGKTVRMKCRKCGHLIEVRAAVTETSVAAGLPSEPPAAPGGPPKPPPAPGKPSVLPGRTPLATSLSQAKPPVPRPGAAKTEGGLANAFKSSMQTKEDEAALLELSSADEWYAAINGVPVGPIRIGELRRKAALGAVTDESLVWQEGMEEWRAVRSIPELATMVREAASSGRVSLLSPDPPNVSSGRQSNLPPAPSQSQRPPARPAAPARQAPEPPRPAPLTASARNNVVPITSRLATAERLDEAPAATASPAGAPTSERFSIAPDPFSAPSAPIGTPPPAQVAATAPAPPSAQAPFIVQMPRQPNYIGIGMILAMVAFGGVAAWALFFKQPAPVAPQREVVTQYLPMPTAAPTATQIELPASSVSGRVAMNGKPGVAPKASASAAPGVDLKGLMGAPGGPSGPDLSGLQTKGPGVAGQQLTSGQLEGVLNGHRIGIKRTCWERAGATSSANELVHVTIDGNGHVTSAQAEGNNGAVGTCLEKEIRGWSFPPTGATTKTDIPFKFVLQ